MSAGDRDPQYPRHWLVYDSDDEEHKRPYGPYEAWHADAAAEQMAEEVFNDGNGAEWFPLTVVVVNERAPTEVTRHVVELDWEPTFASSPE